LDSQPAATILQTTTTDEKLSFARIRVGDLAATVVFGDKDYAISARGRAGGVLGQGLACPYAAG
jgi:hypothetical protein